MHLKSCPKLLRSELRLDLGQQQQLRRSQSQRLPLAALSTNTLRCSPAGGAVLAARGKGLENAVFTEEDGGGSLDVWSVIRPGHVREKIALFAHDTDRKTKGSWDVSAKRRRRTSQIPAPAAVLQSPQAVVTLSLQPAIREPPSEPPSPLTPAEPPSPLPPADSSDDDSKLSVVEMVAFLERRVVTCSPRFAKLRSSASIILSRAPPPYNAAPPPTVSVQPITTQQPEEADSVSVSDMVAKLESQCLRRRSQNERRAVGRVLLAEQNQSHGINLQPLASSQSLKATPSPSHRAAKSNVTTCFAADANNAVANKSATPASTSLSKTSNAIASGRTNLPPSCDSELLQLCKQDTPPQTKPNETQTCEETPQSEANSPNKSTLDSAFAPEAASAKILDGMVEDFCEIKATEFAEPDKTLTAVCAKTVAAKSSPASVLETKTSCESLTQDEPMPGLLFLTPPSCVQSEQRKAPSPASLSPNSDSSLVVFTPDLAVQSESIISSDSFVLLSLDFSAQSQTRKQCSVSRSAASSSEQSEKRKRRCSQSPASTHDPSPIRKAQSGCRDVAQSEKSCLNAAKASTNKNHQSHNSTSLSQLEMSKSCPVTVSELCIQSEATITLLPLESQSRRRRLRRIAQSEKRKSCPVVVHDWFNSEENDQSQSRKLPSDTSLDAIQPECRMLTDQSASRVLARPVAAVLRSVSDVGSERRRCRRVTRAFSLCSEGAGPGGWDFLSMRRRVQSLLEPRSSVSFLSLLPHHLLLQLLLLLPTHALAALKCSCRYLQLVINTYDPRPCDALWVRDPRYRDDPCKQCKRRRRRGDVSLCRWHHKPFCQALPYGPGFWMCCHGDRRDQPGCNVGLHDNRWVPAFHSINAPLYRQRREQDET
ncbi:unnamed protein product [Knipowitschia caucasica]